MKKTDLKLWDGPLQQQTWRSPTSFSEPFEVFGAANFNDRKNIGNNKGGRRQMKKTEMVETPTRVTPASVTQDVATTLQSQAHECHALGDAQIPTGDTVFKAASLKKAKVEMPPTYLNLLLLQQVLETTDKHLSGGRNSKRDLKHMTECLRAQYTNFETSWKESMRSRTGDIYFQESSDLFFTAFEAVDKAYEAIAKAGDKAKTTTSKTTTTSKMATTSKTTTEAEGHLATGLVASKELENLLTGFEAAMAVETEEVKEPWERLGRIDYTDLSTLYPCSGVTVTPMTVTTPMVAWLTRGVPAPAPTPTEVKPVLTSTKGQAAARLELLCSVPLSKLPGLTFEPAMSPGEGETEALLPDSGEPEVMLPGDGETEAVLPDSGEPEAMLLGDRETEAVLPDSGEYYHLQVQANSKKIVQKNRCYF